MINIIHKFMLEYLLDISNYNLRMSNLAYVEIKVPLFQIAPRRFRSAKFKVLEAVYSFSFNPHSFPLSVIPKISNCSGQYLNWNTHHTVIVRWYCVRKRYLNSIIIVIMIVCAFTFYFFVSGKTKIIRHRH